MTWWPFIRKPPHKITAWNVFKNSLSLLCLNKSRDRIINYEYKIMHAGILCSHTRHRMIKGDLIESDLWQSITFLIDNRLLVTVKHIIYLLSPLTKRRPASTDAPLLYTNKHGRARVCADVHMQVHNVCTLVCANEQDINGESRHKALWQSA